MFTNRVLTADEAHSWGAITTVVKDDELMAAVEKIAQMFVNGAKGSNSGIKKLLLQTWSNDLETQMEQEGVIIADNADGIDGREGVSAFLAKRKPEYQ